MMGVRPCWPFQSMKRAILVRKMLRGLGLCKSVAELGSFMGGAPASTRFPGIRRFRDAGDRPRAIDVVPIAIDKNGRWLRAQFDGTQAVATGEPVALLTDPTNPRLVSLAGSGLSRSTSSSPSCTVPWGRWHATGAAGDGGSPLRRCRSVGQRGRMDKGIMKALFAQAGLPQVPYQVLLRSEWERSPAKIVQRLEGTWLTRCCETGQSGFKCGGEQSAGPGATQCGYCKGGGI